VQETTLLMVNGSWVAMEAAVLFAKQAALNSLGTEPEFTGYSAQVDIADPEKLKSWPQRDTHRHVPSIAARLPGDAGI
jgi:hypothetical protein